MTDADVAYVRANYVSLEQACAGRPETAADVRALIVARAFPQPSYVLPGGTEMVPADYFALADAAGVEGMRAEFARRFLAAGGDPALADEEWDGYLSGAYGVCLKEQTPENIVRKDHLVRAIDRLLETARPDHPSWRDRLRAAVDELDALERPFAPDYDRTRWGPSTRDRCITASRERFPDLFAPAGARSRQASSA